MHRLIWIMRSASSLGAFANAFEQPTRKASTLWQSYLYFHQHSTLESLHKTLGSQCLGTQSGPDIRVNKTNEFSFGQLPQTRCMLS